MTKPIPYHKGLPVVGVLNDFSSDQLGFFRRMRDTYGDIVSFQFFLYRVMMLNHPDLIQSALVEHASKMQKAPLDHAIFENFLGNGLIISEGEMHKRQRKLMQPAFHSKRIESYGTVTTDFTTQMIDDWQDGASLDIHAEMTRLTLLVVSKVLYDADVSQQADGIGDAIHILNHHGEEQFKRGFVFPNWLPVKENRDIRSSMAEVNAVMMPIIEARRKANEDRGDLLSMLLAAQDEETGSGMSDQQVRDEAVTLFIAGHETTSNALAWTWALLSQHPDVEARLYAELDSVLGGRTPEVSDLPKLKYTDWVIKESMRLYPPAWILNARVPQEDIEIDGYAIPKDTWLFISPYVMHRDPRYFDHPDVFMPERWANDFDKQIPRYAYFPFGGGPRVCIGNSFAMMEARLVLATVAQHYQLRLNPAHKLEPEPLITLRPKHGLPMILHKRAPRPVSAGEAAVPVQVG
ncbi:MAG: cytochrome P450 [Anaerolineae bacterium]